MRVRMEDKAGAFVAYLTDQSGLEWSVARNAPGAIKLTYPRGTEVGELLAGWDAAGYLVVPAPWGDEYFLLDEDGDNPTEDTGQVRPLAVGGRGMLGELEHAKVYPEGHVPGEPLIGFRQGGHPFVDVSPGGILGTLVSRAKLRGGLARFTVGFTNAADSNGVPWPTLYTREWAAGTDLLKVVADLTDAGWCDVRMNGTRLDAYVPDTLYVDRPQAVLRTGQNVRAGDRRRTRADVRTVLLTAGDNDVMIEAADAAALAAYGRREAYDGRSGVTDPDLLEQMSAEVLAGLGVPSQTFTLAWVPDENTPVAGVAFREGDWIRWNGRRVSSTELEPLRVNSLAFAYEGDNLIPVVSAELADRWVEGDIARQRRLDALTLRSQVGAPLPRENPLADTTRPLAPTDVAATATVVVTRGSSSPLDPGRAEPSIVVDWGLVNRNEDGTVYDDHREYLISTRYPAESLDAEWTSEETAIAGPVTLTGFPWDTNVSVRVRAVDRAGNPSQFGYATSVRTWKPYAVPEAPSAPTVSSKLGRVWVTWNGQQADGGTFVAPVAGIEVHASAESGFPITDATRVEFLPLVGGTVVIPPRSYDAPTYVKLVAVDSLGQRGPASAQGSATAARLVPAELTDGAVTSAKLADLAVVSAKIATGAVNNAKILSVSAGAITAGSLSATVTVVGRLRTAATNARVEVGGDGLTAYNASGQRTVFIEAATGNAFFAGSITAAQFTATIAMRSTSITGANVTLEAAGASAISGFGAVGLRTGYAGAKSAGALMAESSSQTIGEAFRIGTFLRSEGTDVYQPTDGQPARRNVIIEASYGMSANQVRLWTLTANSSQAVNRRRLSSGEPTHKFTGGHSGNVWVELKTTNAVTRPADDPLAPNAVAHSEVYVQFRQVATAFEVWTEAVDRTAYYNDVPLASASGEGTTRMRAASFPAQSGSAVKTGIRPLEGRALDVVLANPAHLWSYLVGDGQVQIGPLADGLPDYMVERLDDGRLFMETNAEYGVLWEAIRELDAELTLAGV